MLFGEGLEIKITYDSQVQGTLVSHSMQRKSFKLPTLLKILIYFEILQNFLKWQTCREFVSQTVTTEHVQTVRHNLILENMQSGMLFLKQLYATQHFM